MTSLQIVDNKQTNVKIMLYLYQPSYVIIKKWGDGNITTVSGVFKNKEKAEAELRHRILEQENLRRINEPVTMVTDGEFALLEITCNIKEC